MTEIEPQPISRNRTELINIPKKEKHGTHARTAHTRMVRVSIEHTQQTREQKRKAEEVEMASRKSGRLTEPMVKTRDPLGPVPLGQETNEELIRKWIGPNAVVDAHTIDDFIKTIGTEIQKEKDEVSLYSCRVCCRLTHMLLQSLTSATGRDCSSSRSTRSSP